VSQRRSDERLRRERTLAVDMGTMHFAADVKGLGQGFEGGDLDTAKWWSPTFLRRSKGVPPLSVCQKVSKDE
jgi:hypothetical protein